VLPGPPEAVGVLQDPPEARQDPPVPVQETPVPQMPVPGTSVPGTPVPHSSSGPVAAPDRR
jgi:hypothetical protein